jgi:hypothetical protein
MNGLAVPLAVPIEAHDFIFDVDLLAVNAAFCVFDGRFCTQGRVDTVAWAEIT